MDRILDELRLLVTNAKKSRNRKYTRETITDKLNKIRQLSHSFGKLAKHLSTPLRGKKISEFKELKQTALLLLNEHSEDNPSISENSLEIFDETESKILIMTDFDARQASNTIPVFDGKPKHLSIFFSMVELVYNTLNADGKKHLIKYVVAMKLEDRVRDVLMTENEPTTYEELKTSLSKNFKFLKTAGSIHAEIRGLRQTGKVLGYKEKLTALVAELTLVQISDLGENVSNIARSTIKSMNENLALQIFQEGLYDNIRIAVIAAQPKTLAQAYEIACTQERIVSQTDTAKVFHTHGHNNNRKNGRYRNKNNSNGNYSGNNGNNSTSNTNNGNRSNNYNNRDNGNRNNNDNRNNGNRNNYNNRNNGNQNNYNNRNNGNRNNYNNRNNGSRNNSNGNRNNNGNNGNIRVVQGNEETPESQDGTLERGN